MGIELSIGWITLILFGGILIILLTGLPVAFGLGSIAIIVGLIFAGPKVLTLTYFATFKHATSFLFIAIPMFVYMAHVLAASGIAESLYYSFSSFIGRIRGGLAVATTWVCAVLGAMIGTSTGAALVTGVVAYPEMAKYGYDKKLAAGCVAAAGALGSLIPPSLGFILIGALAGESIIQLFAAGIIPGIIMASLFTTYILIRCRFQPHLGPASPLRFTLREKASTLKG